MINQVNREVSSTRMRLLESARHLFWEKGFAATGMAELLERAQANSGSFYHFFESKEALLLALLESYLDGLHPVIVQPAEAAFADPMNRIFGILQGYRERLIATGRQLWMPDRPPGSGNRGRKPAGASPHRVKLRSLDWSGPPVPGGRTGTVSIRDRS